MSMLDELKEDAKSAKALEEKGLAQCFECLRTFPKEEIVDGFCIECASMDELR